MTTASAEANILDSPVTGIFFIVLGMAFISVNDALIKFLSDAYPLHQIVFVRSLVGITVSLMIVRFEGGLGILRTTRPGLHLLRGLLLVIANLTFFLALAAMPIAEATAIFFVAPLFITLLSIPILKDKVGLRRIAAVIVGFGGVLVMLRPGGDEGAPGLLISLLPVVAALTYALFQLLTRKLGGISKASAMAVYIQGLFIIVGLGFFAVAGDGRFTDDVSGASLTFLLRAWSWPAGRDMVLLLALGVLSAGIAYALSQAYRSASAATVAPFEYIAMPLAALWGFLIWNEVPDLRAAAGMALILGSGLYVLAREQRRRRPIRGSRPVRR